MMRVGGLVVALLALAAPLAHGAPHAGKIHRIGVLEIAGAASNAAYLDAFRRGLAEHGYVEGRNLVIEYRSADGRPERFSDLATELVRLEVDVLVTRGTPATLAARRATQTIPIVMAWSGEQGAPPRDSPGSAAASGPHRALSEGGTSGGLYLGAGRGPVRQ
jgi:ABC-type uncharacterized transport system substrate-binding protein